MGRYKQQGWSGRVRLTSSPRVTSSEHAGQRCIGCGTTYTGVALVTTQVFTR